jgi:iron(III) transport system substrate-binding protein
MAIARYLAATLAAVLALVAPAVTRANEVVVYTSVDQVFAEPVLKRFEKDTGIQVKAVYDAEASKTVGLERRILAERERPRADVFWNSEYLRTMRLAAAGVLEPHKLSPSAGIPAEYRAADGLWTGFGGRARVLLVNRKLVPESQFPRRLADLIDPRWKGKMAVARPYFGTTSTHFAALYVRWGAQRYVDFLERLKANRVTLLPGNSDVRDAVVAGRYAIGLTDTDDAAGPVREGKPVAMVFLDQDAEGAFEVFHTVARVRGGPNAHNARRLIEHLTSEAVERELLRAGAAQVAVRAGLSSMSPAGATRRWHLIEPALLEATGESARLARAHLE